MMTQKFTLPTVNLDMLAYSTLAGVVSGALIGGIGARIAMRLVQLVAGGTPSFSLEGTILIVIVFAMFGFLAGILYSIIVPFLPGSHLSTGAIYGGILMLLLLWLFLSAPGGEFALIGPWRGFAIFAPIPLLFAVGMTTLIEALQRRFAGAEPRRVGVGWMLAFALALFAAFAALTTTMESSPRTPALIQRWLGAAGYPYYEYINLQRMLGTLFHLAWLISCITIFCRKGESPQARSAAIILLVFGASFFTDGSLWSGWFGAGGAWLLQGMAAVLLGWLLYGLVANQRGGVRAGISAGLGLILLLWVTIGLVPELHFRHLNLFSTFFIVVLYWLPWLLIPFTLLGVQRWEK